jgi:hypothetical protein
MYLCELSAFAEYFIDHVAEEFCRTIIYLFSLFAHISFIIMLLSGNI